MRVVLAVMVVLGAVQVAVVVLPPAAGARASPVVVVVVRVVPRKEVGRGLIQQGVALCL